ncbi:hypothetical protein L484_005690 [Morus notabilis]|uniref:Uncharacterized protein n=1 Tax=Morus notabilis TaxID=981085 RepID=W9S721_9ROSA|nr:hypothetical protein L484_005690 [Morus notabilis]
MPKGRGAASAETRENNSMAEGELGRDEKENEMLRCGWGGAGWVCGLCGFINTPIWSPLSVR